MSGMRDRLTRIERGLEDPRVDVLELVNWVYAEQQLAHLAQHRGSDYRWLVGAGISADGVVAVARIGILGVRVEVSAATPLGGWVLPGRKPSRAARVPINASESGLK
jgi:hypothetical protein